MKQGKINKVEDLKGKTIGVENKTSVSSITDALAQVQEKIGKEHERKIIVIMLI